jgi:hypothetical protein
LRTVLALAAWLAGAAAVGAEGLVSPGERVRFRAATVGGGRQQGTVVEQDATALTIRLTAGGDPIRVPLDAFERLEVARSQRRHFWTGAAVGFVPGFAFGFFAGWVLGCDDQGRDCTAYGAALATGAILGAGTAVVGGLVGLLFKSDRWERVSTSRVRVTLLPLPRRGVAIGVSVSF